MNDTDDLTGQMWCRAGCLILSALLAGLLVARWGRLEWADRTFVALAAVGILAPLLPDRKRRARSPDRADIRYGHPAPNRRIRDAR